MTLSNFYREEMKKIISYVVKNVMTEKDFEIMALLDINQMERCSIFSIEKAPDGNNTYVTLYDHEIQRSRLILISMNRSNNDLEQLEQEKPGFDNYFIYSYLDKLLPPIMLLSYYDEKKYLHPELEHLIEEIEKKSEMVYRERQLYCVNLPGV